MNEDAQKVAAWLKSLPNVTLASPVSVVLQNVTYYGALYPQYIKNTPSLYLLGRKPEIKVKGKTKKNVCFKIPNDDADWYIAGYTDTESVIKKEFHPFGHNFVISRWYIPPAYEDGRSNPYHNTRIDEHENHKYLRITIQLNMLE